MTTKIEDGGLPTPEWRTDPMPMDGTPIYRRVWTVYRFQPYKPNSDQFRHRNRELADYSVKKQIAFDAFYFAAAPKEASHDGD